MPPKWLTAGVVGKPHGLDGSFHVHAPRPQLLALGAEVRVSTTGAIAEIARRAGTDERPIVRLSTAATREAIEALRGAELAVPQSVAPPLEEDEWYAADLQGLAVRDGSRAVGVVRRLLAYPSCEVLEVERPGTADLLVPLVSDAVREVDLEAGVVDVDLDFLGEDPT